MRAADGAPSFPSGPGRAYLTSRKFSTPFAPNVWRATSAACWYVSFEATVPRSS